MQKLILIVGPTAVGKTALSIEIARTVSGEVISADSRQVYRGLSVGTGKITKKEMRGVRHHLLDVADPKRVFNASDYVRLGRSAISEIAERGHTPIVVGGTGFYIDALVGRIALAEVPPNPALRKTLEKKSLAQLNALLKKLDPKRAKTIDTKNRVRVVRAIEIARALGSVPNVPQKKLYEALWIGVTLPQEKLAQKIHIRLFARIRGIVSEVKTLRRKGIPWKRLEALGLEYRYGARYIQGKLSREEMLRELESEIRKYAKRQMTWFKRNKEIHWVDPKKAIVLAKKFFKK